MLIVFTAFFMCLYSQHKAPDPCGTLDTVASGIVPFSISLVATTELTGKKEIYQWKMKRRLHKKK